MTTNGLPGLNTHAPTHAKKPPKVTDKSSATDVAEGDMRTETILVTPERARVWLAKNTINRPISRAFVQSLAFDILNGDFELTEQGIAIDAEGNLVDGQHRLSAIVEAGAPVRLRVTFGAPDIRKIRDRGRGRRTGDFLFNASGEVVADSSRISTICSLWGRLLDVGARTPSAGVVRALFAEHESALVWASRLPNRVCSPVRAAAAYAYPCATESVSAFMQRYLEGDNLEANSPVLALIHICPPGRRARQPGGAHYGLDDMRRTFNALRAYILGRKIVRVDSTPGGYEFFRARRGGS